MTKNYYEILEVEENATEEQIKKSYRNLSKKYHPDVNPNGTEKFKEIAEAYETLNSPEKRKEYDFRRKNPFEGSFNVEDIFSQMFGNNNFGQRRKNAPDKLVKLQVTPIESFLGSEKSLIYMRELYCDICKGTGGEQQSCLSCKGNGFHIKTFGTGFLVQQVRATCESCGGRGYTLVHRCYSCGGKGTKGSASEVNIKLPVGIDSGQYLKMPDMGDFVGGTYGDLVIQIEVIPKDGFEKINNDLVYNLILNLEEIKKCGDLIYRKNQFWEFIPSGGNPKKEQILAKALGFVDRSGREETDFIRKQGGAWLVNVTKPSNFETLESEEKKSLDRQIDAMIERKYKFINSKTIQV